VTVAAEPRSDLFLDMLEPADREAFLRAGRLRVFAPGQALLHQGQVPDRVLLLRSGRVKVYSATPTGKEVVLAFRGPGQLVGEQAAIDEAPRSASIVALERVEALVLTSADFRRFVMEHSGASFVLLRMLSLRLRDADAKRIEYVALQSMGRVAARIVEMAESFGRQQGETIEVEQLTHDDLAGWSGASPESVGRALQKMRELGWIETGRRHIRILRLEDIRRAAE
jgi:CRP-like cAMP-binding protein